MRWSCIGSALFFILASAGTQASAEPIQYVATFFIGLDGVNTMKPVDIPDPILGGSVVLGGANLSHGSSATSVPGAPPEQSIDQTFSFQLGIKAPAGASGPLVNPFLDVTGQITGSISGPDPMMGRYSGGFSGTAASITVPFLPPGSTLSPALEALLEDPGRIHLSGLVTGGPANVLETKLTIDALAPGDPTPVPEPATLTTFAAVLGALTVVRRRRPRRN
jgi:hypothetical protein